MFTLLLKQNRRNRLVAVNPIKNGNTIQENKKKK